MRCFVHFHFQMCFSTSELQKVVRTCGALYIFISKCAFRRSGVHFFDIWTSKSGPDMRCFVHFHFQMRFSPQRRAFFRHLNFKKWSGHAVFCTFSFPNVLFATAACNFSTSELTKVLQAPHVLYIFTSKCAFRHSGVQFLISPLSTDLRTRRFNRPTFRLTRHTNHWKNTAFRDFSNIWCGCIFFLLTFALLHLLSADLTTLLCFSTVHIVGSFYLNFLRLFKTKPSNQHKRHCSNPFVVPRVYEFGDVFLPQPKTLDVCGILVHHFLLLALRLRWRVAPCYESQTFNLCIGRFTHIEASNVDKYYIHGASRSFTIGSKSLHFKQYSQKMVGPFLGFQIFTEVAIACSDLPNLKDSHFQKLGGFLASQGYNSPCPKDPGLSKERDSPLKSYSGNGIETINPWVLGVCNLKPM